MQGALAEPGYGGDGKLERGDGDGGHHGEDGGEGGVGGLAALMVMVAMMSEVVEGSGWEYSETQVGAEIAMGEVMRGGRDALGEVARCVGMPR